jgi:hypothetical protein
MKSDPAPASCPAPRNTELFHARRVATTVSLKHRVVFSLIMGVITTGTISFTLIALNLGFTERFLRIWLKSWGVGYMVAIPAILILGPLVQRAVDRWLGKPEGSPA